MSDYGRGFLVSILIVTFFVCLIRFPIDDGLRHVVLAFNGPSGWGAVYPYSIFETFNDYDPWLGYDLVLRGAAYILELLPFSRLFHRFLLAKILLLVFPAALLYLVLRRSGILEEIKDGYSFALAYIILLVALFPTLLRFSLIRPFALGTLYLIYTVGQKGITRGLISSAALAFFYPYLAWLYTIPSALAHYLKGDKRFALGAVSSTIVFLLLQSDSFWGFQAALIKSDAIRRMLDKKIGEFAPSYHNLPLYAFYAAAFLLVFLPFDKEARKLNYQRLLLLLYLIPSFRYTRYFLDITLPLLFVSFEKEALKKLLEGFCKTVSFLAETRGRSRRGKPGKETGSVNLKPYIVILYAISFCLVFLHNYKQFASCQRFQERLSDIPAGSLVLTDFNSQYKVLYTRPDLQLVPSCELGFPQEGIKQEYTGFFNEGKVCSLARKVRARFYLESRRSYLDPEDVNCLELVKGTRYFRVWRVIY